MPKSSNLKFNYLESAQAQKHLTVNNALMKLDALQNIVFLGLSQTLPENPEDGTCYVVPISHLEHANEVAIASGGGYQFIVPKFGWRASDTHGQIYEFNGVEWQGQKSNTITNFNIDLANSDRILIPEKSIVLGVTARVISEITGQGIASWSIGVADDMSRYGSGLWLGTNGWARGMTSSPMTYWSDTELIVAPDAGTFQTGVINIFLHVIEPPVPPEV